MTATVATPDIRVENHGSLFLFRVLTPEAQAWVDEHIPDTAQWMGNGFAVEHRYAETVATGMTNDGLTVQ